MRFSSFFSGGFITAIVVKFIYSEKATKFCKISTLLLSYVVTVKSKVEISQNFVAFSEYMNFTTMTLIAAATAHSAPGTQCKELSRWKEKWKESRISNEVRNLIGLRKGKVP